MVDLMPATTISDLIRTVLVTVIDRPAFLILNVVYQVFFNVATVELFSNVTVRTIYYRCQMVIGIFMLFKFAVTILEGIVDPTRITDKKQGAGKIITRIITSLVILALITPINIPNPANKWEEQLKNNGIIFGALYSLQDRILTNNTLGKLILGTLEDSDAKNNSVAEAGSQFAKSIAQSFIRYNLKSGTLDPPPDGREYEDVISNRVCTTDSDVEDKYNNGNTQEILSLVNLECSAQNGGNLSSTLKKVFGGAQYVFAYSPIGGICAYIISIILIGFTVDIAIRAIKLAVLRLIAPIPIISHMNISAKESKGADSFSLWVKSLTTTYLDLFIRLAVLYFVLALIQQMISPGGVRIKLGTGLPGALAFVFVVIGLLLFARQAPKFLQDALGLQGTMSNIGLSAILSGAGALRQGGTFQDALWAGRDSVDNNINAINSGKAPPSVGMAYNAGRDLAAQIITGNDKMTARAMARGRGRLAQMGITPNIAEKYKDSMKLQKNILQGLEDAQHAGPVKDKNGNSRGYYNVTYADASGGIHTTQVREADMAARLTEQRGRAAKAESAYNDIKAEQQKYGQTVGYREEKRGRTHPYRSARSQNRRPTTMPDNWYDNTANEFNTDNSARVKPPDNRML